MPMHQNQRSLHKATLRENLATDSSPSLTELIVPQPLEASELSSIANASLTINRLKKVYGEVKVKGLKQEI